MTPFYGNNQTPQMIPMGDGKFLANYSGARIGISGIKWKAFPKVGDTIFVKTTRNTGGFSCSELEPLEVVDLMPDQNIILCNHHGIELPVGFIVTPANDKDLIAYFIPRI